MSDFQLAGYPDNLRAISVTVPTGATGVSEEIAPQGMALVGILMPTVWVAAAIGYQISVDGKRFVVLQSGGVAVTTTATQDTFVAFPTPDALFVPFIKIASVTVNTATPVDQTANRTVILLFRKLFN